MRVQDASAASERAPKMPAGFGRKTQGTRRKPGPAFPEEVSHDV